MRPIASFRMGGPFQARRHVLPLLAFLALAAGLFGLSDVALAEEPKFEPGAVLVRWGAGVRAQQAITLGFEAQPAGSIPELGITKLRVPPGREQEAIDALKSAGAEIAEPNYLRQLSYVPNDPLLGYQWGVTKIRASSAWDLTRGSPSTVVAVIDTGIDTAHPDRPQNLILGPDYIVDAAGQAMVSSDPQGHGTHVSGIIAAGMNNGAGIAGVAPGVSLMAIRALDAFGNGDSDTTARGIVYAADHGARVINMSLSGFGSSFAERSAVDYAHLKGVVIVAAAGNCYQGGADCEYLANPVMYPAALDNVIGVSATSSNDGHAYYSETGSYVDLSAPGGGSSSDAILSTCRGGAYCQKAGTSMAAPHVAGVAALILSVNPALSPDHVENIMRQTAADLGTSGRDDTFGYGRVDAFRAVQQAQSTLSYRAQFVAQSFPLILAPGEKFTGSLQVMNTGGATWFKSGPNPVRLGTSQPLSRSSSFYTPGNWLSPDRPASLAQESVAPGQEGRFDFVLTAPAGGTFIEYFQVVSEGNTWISEPLVWFKVSVVLPNLPMKLYLPLLASGLAAW